MKHNLNEKALHAIKILKSYIYECTKDGYEKFDSEPYSCIEHIQTMIDRVENEILGENQK